MADSGLPDETPVPLFLLPCSICSRTFRPEVLTRHEKVCEKSVVKKRKVFDSFKCRVEGTDLAEYLGPTPLPGQQLKAPAKVAQKKPENEKPKVPKWRQTHEALVATLRAARGEQPTSTTATLPITTVTDHEQCPTCGRNFGPRAYDRHVEFCKEMMARKARTPPKNEAAHSRQQARTQYQAPLSIKRSRPDVTITKLPSTTTISNRPQSLPVAATPATPKPSRRAVATAPPHRAATTASHRLPPATAHTRTNRSLSTDKSPKPTESLTRGPLRTSLRVRGVSPGKVPPTRKESISNKENSPGEGRKKEMKKSMSDNFDSNKNSSLNRTFCKPSMADITAAADQQMRDLLSWSSENDLAAQAQTKPMHSASPVDQRPVKHESPHHKIIQPRLTPSPKSSLPNIHRSPKSASPLHASPTSAFSPVLSSSNNKSFSFDENDNSMHNLEKYNWSDHSYDEYNQLWSTPKPKPAPRAPATVRKSLGTNLCDQLTKIDNRRHSTASLTSQSSASTLIDEGILWAQLEAQMQPLSRTRKKDFARSKSVFEDRNRMLYLQTYVPDLSSSDEDVPDEMTAPSKLRARPAHKNRKEKLDCINDNGGGGDAARETGLAGGDSAYSSLNRRSPVVVSHSNNNGQRKLSTFCHECGCMYPVTTAKFCCQCGIQRLSLTTCGNNP